MFGFARFGAVSIGSFILAVAGLNAYVGYRSGEEMLGRLPGFDAISKHPLNWSIMGGLLVLVALLLPTPKPRIRNDWEEPPMPGGFRSF